MPLILNQRDTESTELMDDENCDRDALNNTYRQFSKINSLISGWKHIYNSRIKPVIKGSDRPYSLLDIGFGGGDIPIKLAQWAAHDKVNLHITAIETDPRALAYAQSIAIPENVTFMHCSSGAMVDSGRTFDFVISNHLLHHLNGHNFHQLLNESEQLSKRLVLFNDIERSDIGYALFNLLSRPVFRSSFITHDGLTSIKRSYTLEELRKQVPNSWDAERLFPFRLLLSYEHKRKSY